ncbi:MAG: choice-of-anchor tandem repeat GloVer-containing protein [Rhizomicrobium sp.]
MLEISRLAGKWLLGSALALVLLVPSGHAHAKNGAKVLYSFQGGSDGAAPYAGLIADKAGNLYGTTYLGGGSGCDQGNGCGTVFSLANGAETVLHAFVGQPGDGAWPWAGLIADDAGNFHGTTTAGGADASGTVFELAAGGTETTLYTFTGGSDGGDPVGGLLADAAGNLYGTTELGGADSAGAVFMLAPDGTETVLYPFTGAADGAYPLAGLIADSAGNLYGTTSRGGADDWGTVFKVAPDGTETVLYSFTDKGDGGFPAAGLIADKAGNFYGTTKGGGKSGIGTVFELAPDGTETVLHSFDRKTGDGAYPWAGVIADKAGNLYGTTAGGGAGNDGIVFEIASDGTETVLHAFTGGRDGAYPLGGVVADKKGNLFGTTELGGSGSACPDGCGAIFEIRK